VGPCCVVSRSLAWQPGDRAKQVFVGGVGVDHWPSSAYTLPLRALFVGQGPGRNLSRPGGLRRLRAEALRRARATIRRRTGPWLWLDQRKGRACQRLYEGVELGDEGPTGLITYMRTDSTRLSEDAVNDVRAWIVDRYGEASRPAEPNVFKSKKSAQDAHEAIRPTSTQYDSRDRAASAFRNRECPGRARSGGFAQALHPHLESLCGLPDGLAGPRPTRPSCPLFKIAATWRRRKAVSVPPSWAWW